MCSWFVRVDFLCVYFMGVLCVFLSACILGVCNVWVCVCLGVFSGMQFCICFFSVCIVGCM